jgi:hypothetical protein
MGEPLVYRRVVLDLDPGESRLFSQSLISAYDVRGTLLQLLQLVLLGTNFLNDTLHVFELLAHCLYTYAKLG